MPSRQEGAGRGMLVEELQESIARATGILPCEQRLVYQGVQLCGRKRLDDYAITPGGGQTVHVMLSLKGGMPATAPRIKMPANNRMHSSAALRTTDMWSNVIGDDFGKANDAAGAAAAAGGSGQGNAYEMSQNLMQLARLSGASKGDAKRGACKRCGEIGHLAFQCFNHVQAKKQVAGDISSTSSEEEDDDDNKSIGSVSSTSSEGGSPRLPPSVMVPPRGSSSSSGRKRSREDEGKDRDKDKKKRKKEKKEKKEKKSKDKDKKKKKHKKSKKEKKSKKDRD
mmetsp:Transcript_27101/g.68294  ORF Transcript_27101/g.68294 Transcript_27101/m.68294 type:complete len:282 (+) Transcript_27101:3-848(+)